MKALAAEHADKSVHKFELLDCPVSPAVMYTNVFCAFCTGHTVALHIAGSISKYAIWAAYCMSKKQLKAGR